MSENNITHKELLTFSNLTNLEWEFVDIEAIKAGEHELDGELSMGDQLSTQLNDLLDPEVFVIRDTEEKDDDSDSNKDDDSDSNKDDDSDSNKDDDENVTYIYGKRDGFNHYIKETGLAEMCEKSGIAMEEHIAIYFIHEKV